MYHAATKQFLQIHEVKQLSWRLAALLLICAAAPLRGQAPAARSLELDQTAYELKIGAPVSIAASIETLDFLSSAKTRTLQIVGSSPSSNAQTRNVVLGADRQGRMVLAAPPLAKPGTYSVVVSATSASGELRQATMAVTVDSLPAVPSSATRNPVVLLNGWEIGFTNSCPISGSSSDTFGNLAQYLNQDGVPDVYLFDNCLEDANQTIEQLGNDLGAFLSSIQYDNGQQVPQIDLVAFSLGGLIARSYLAGLQPSEALTPPANTLVGKMVLIATPNFGSFVAGNNENQFVIGSQSAELIPGSSFLWNLANWNQRSDDLRGVDAIAIIGNAGEYLPSLTATTALNNASDGIVSLSSASIGFVTEQTSSTRIVPYCHVDPSTFTNVNLGTFLCNAPGIANVTSTSHPAGEIVRSFLGGTSAWTSIGTTPASDPYLSTQGGMFFGLGAASGSYASDLRQVAWGTLELTGGGDLETIFYGDFVTGTGVFEATSASLGTVDCGSYSQASGYFSAVRCKIDATILSIGPLLTTSPKVVSSGGTITINGVDFASQCNGCGVTALAANATSAQSLQITSWKNTAITAVLPATFTGLVTITVSAATGSDSMAIMATASTAPVISASPASLQFGFTIGGATPASQSIQISDSGGGTIAWTAAASSSATWLSVSPSSGTAPSTLTVTVSPAGLSAGTYTGSVQLSATGASNTPFSVPITFTVTQAQTPPVLSVAPQSLTFNYAFGGSPPAAQTVSVTNTGSGTLSWTAAPSAYWITLNPASGSAPGTVSVSMNPANLAAGTYQGTIQITSAGATGSPASIAVTLVVTGAPPAPSITSVANAADFQPTAASATWLSVFGSNLSSVTYTWQASDFVNGALPTSLEGVSATINGIPAFIEYISPTQINLLAPDDATTGAVQVQVTVAQQASNSLTVDKSNFAPAFFTIDNGAYVAAQHANYTVVGSANLLPGATTSPAQPGETILLYATGLGPTNPPSPTGQLVTSPATLANSVQVTIGGAVANVVFAGLIAPGEYQLNVTVPNLPNGDASIAASIGGASSQSGLSITVQQ